MEELEEDEVKDSNLNQTRLIVYSSGPTQATTAEIEQSRSPWRKDFNEEFLRHLSLLAEIYDNLDDRDAISRLGARYLFAICAAQAIFGDMLNCPSLDAASDSASESESTNVVNFARTGRYIGDITEPILNRYLKPRSPRYNVVTVYRSLAETNRSDSTSDSDITPDSDSSESDPDESGDFTQIQMIQIQTTQMSQE
ncbi:hypothetical protein C5167_007976 [Papaver somniferum]|uniref:Uncharacterized protein n=1 Tax=Papaver somniferum TaxID=3469 RepID=A0A4Y7JW51_PAPSO|nr:hypothetical protein C5167_007976 [Papaver somniferum]